MSLGKSNVTKWRDRNPIPRTDTKNCVFIFECPDGKPAYNGTFAGIERFLAFTCGSHGLPRFKANYGAKFIEHPAFQLPGIIGERQVGLPNKMNVTGIYLEIKVDALGFGCDVGNPGAGPIPDGYFFSPFRVLVFGGAKE
ncbi:MAG: hypothetical protein ACYTBJ_13735 [Planctomycetota bacterium]